MAIASASPVMLLTMVVVNVEFGQIGVALDAAAEEIPHGVVDGFPGP